MRLVLEAMTRIDVAIALFSRAVVGLLVLFLVVLVTYSVILRYVFNNAPPHTDEIATFLVVGIVFLGAAAAFVSKSQVRVMVFDRFMPDRVRQYVRLVTLLLVLGVVVLMSYEAVSEMLFLKGIGMQVQMWRGVKLWWPFLVLPVGLILFGVVVVQEMVRHTLLHFTDYGMDEGNVSVDPSEKNAS